MTQDEIEGAKAAAIAEKALLLRWQEGESDLWKWVQLWLTKSQRQLSALIGDPRLTNESRAVLAGKLSLVIELLETPANLLAIYENAEKQSAARANVVPLRGRAAPKAVPSAV